MGGLDFGSGNTWLLALTMGQQIKLEIPVQMRRAVSKIEQSRKSGFFMVLDRAVADTQTPHMTSELAKAFQHATRCEVGDRLFLEVCYCSMNDGITSHQDLARLVPPCIFASVLDPFLLLSISV